MTAGNLAHDPSTNNPPETLEEKIRRENAEFLKGAQAWIESVARVPAEITDDATNEKVGKTVQELTKAANKAKTIHATAKAPHLEACRTVDTIFLTGVVKAAADGKEKLVKRQSAFLTKKKAAMDAIAEAEARARREEADVAMRAAERAQDVGETDRAMEHIETAAAAEEAAVAAETKLEAKPADALRVHSSHGVTISATTVWETEYVGPRAAIDWAAIGAYIPDAEILKAAKAAVKAGRREIAGFKISEGLKAINR